MRRERCELSGSLRARDAGFEPRHGGEVEDEGVAQHRILLSLPHHGLIVEWNVEVGLRGADDASEACGRDTDDGDAVIAQHEVCADDCGIGVVMPDPELEITVVSAGISRLL